MPLSFLFHFHDGFFNNWIKTTLSFLQSKIGHADKNSIFLYPPILSHGKNHLSMNWHSVSSKSVGISVVRQWNCCITERVLHWFQKLCVSQAFLCLIVIFHKALQLGDNICGRLNPVSINISYKTYKSTKSPIVLQNHFANVQKNQMSLSNGIMRLITLVSKFSCCLYSVKIVCIRSDSVFKSHLFFAKCCHKQKTAVWNLRGRSLFHFVQTTTEKFFQLTAVMKRRLFATSHVIFRIGVMMFLSYCN